MVKKNVQTLDQELLQYSSASFSFWGWQDLTALGAGRWVEGGAAFLCGLWSLKWASLAALLHIPALTSAPLSWHKRFCFFSALASCFQYSLTLEAYWGQTDGLPTYSQTKLLSSFLQVTPRVKRSLPVATQVHSDLSLVAILPLMGCAWTDLGRWPPFSPGLSLCCPLSTPLPLRPGLFWQLLTTSWWEIQARTSRMVTLVRRAMKAARNTLREDKFRFRCLTSNPFHFPA